MLDSGPSTSSTSGKGTLRGTTGRRPQASSRLRRHAILTTQSLHIQ